MLLWRALAMKAATPMVKIIGLPSATRGLFYIILHSNNSSDRASLDTGAVLTARWRIRSSLSREQVRWVRNLI